MFKEFAFRSSYRFIDILDLIVDKYNDKRHRTTQLAPNEINTNNEKAIYKKVYKIRKIGHFARYSIGDAVRISKPIKIFDKSFYPNWSVEIFTIDKVQNTVPVTYILRDYNGEIIKGGFYEEELARVKYPDGYLIEKIVKRGPKKSLVKWWQMEEMTYEPNENL